MALCRQKKMNQELPKESATAWEHLQKSFQRHSDALANYNSWVKEFFQDPHYLAVLKQQLRSRTKSRALALHLLQYLCIEDRLALLPEFLYLACYTSDGDIQRIRDIIASLPRERVLENIETAAEPLLENGSYEEYQMLLELYLVLDDELTVRLARRALQNPISDVKETGEDFLQLLQTSGEKVEDRA